MVTTAKGNQVDIEKRTMQSDIQEATPDTLALGDYLQHLLQKYHLSQRDLARASNIHPVTVNRFVNGEALPTINTVEMLANGLKCNDAERYALHSLCSPVIARLLGAVKATLNHWREFADHPDLAGFGEAIEQNFASFCDEGFYDQHTKTFDDEGGD